MSKIAYKSETGKIITQNGKICTTCCGGWPLCTVRYPDALTADVAYVTLCDGWNVGWICFYCPPFPWIQLAGSPNAVVILTKEGSSSYRGKFGGNNGLGGGPEPGMGDWIGNWILDVTLGCSLVSGVYRTTASVRVYCEAKSWYPDGWHLGGYYTAFSGSGYADSIINNNFIESECGQNDMGVYDNFRVGYGGEIRLTPL